ncbi:MAG TPA: inositol monophosphatase family protein [Solirubrobacteraceae bacterium]|nr:inositol monophosphatase family protein [Solirubrobacteraceae bacterium]
MEALTGHGRPLAYEQSASSAPEHGLGESEINNLLLLAGAVVDHAARLLVRGRAHIGGLISKGDRDYASRVDFQIEDAVREALVRSAADIPFLGEERGGHPRAPLLWVLDPVDGTTNFINGSPLCAISLALLREGQPVFGIVDLPLLGERYVARAGAGAFLNGTRLQRRGCRRLEEAIVGITDFAVADDRYMENPIHIALLAELAPRALGVRAHGSAALDLAWLAAGRMGASIMLSNRAWDVSAGVLLAREAGALTFDWDGSEHDVDSRFTLACDPALKPILLQLLGRVL